jgi:hypothetical protein
MVEIRPAIGYHVLMVYCARCGHVGQVDPARYRRNRGFRCRKCGTRTHEVRLIWREGYPPDNVLPLMRAPEEPGER